MCENHFSISRRTFLGGLGASAALTASPLGMRFAYAGPVSDRRLLVLMLRGGMDGLHAVVPFKDKDYRTARGAMAMPENGLFEIDRGFALHPALAPFRAMYRNGELLIAHAIAQNYRDRSHFEMQDMLENGGLRPHEFKNGWLNRLTNILSTNPSGKENAMMIGDAVSLLLQGQTPVNSWSPAVLNEPRPKFLENVRLMYQHDAALRRKLFSGLEAAEVGRSIAVTGDKQSFDVLAVAAAKFMAPADAPQIGVIDIGGWDTHAGQGLAAGGLATNLETLARGVAKFKQGMGTRWRDTVVIMMTEFGRTVAGNGTGGTDHGTAGVAFVVGGAVNGGRVVGAWPGLAPNRLFENRDLFPANNMHSLLMGVLRNHFNIPAADLREQVFAGSTAPIWSDLVRS